MKKFMSLLRISFVFLFALALSIGTFSNSAWAAGDFSLTCKKVSVSGSVLSASCAKINGEYQDTSINLDPYIANLDGKLSWKGVNFYQTCKDTGLSGSSTLTGKCAKINGSYIPASINLDQHIANLDGNLQYLR